MRNPLRMRLCTFCALQLYMFICCQIPWTFFLDYNDSNEKNEGEADKEGLISCYNSSFTRTGIALLQFVNLISWLSRKEFSKISHLVHFTITNLLMILALIPFQCPHLSKPLPNYFYSLSMTVQIAIFSRMTALAPAHTLLTMLLTLLVHAITVGLSQPQIVSFYDIFVVF